MSSGYQRKTDRVYGAIFRCVRAVAAARAEFRLQDVPLPRQQVEAAVTRLKRNGELRVVSPGRPGRFGSRPAVFARSA